MSEKEVEKIRGVLKEFNRADIIRVLQAMGIQTPVRTIATDSAEIMKEKLKAIVAILESSRFDRVMRQIDISEGIREEAKKDVVSYLKERGIEFPNGINVKIVIREEEKTKAMGLFEMDWFIWTTGEIPAT